MGFIDRNVVLLEDAVNVLELAQNMMRDVYSAAEVSPVNEYVRGWLEGRHSTFTVAAGRINDAVFTQRSRWALARETTQSAMFKLINRFEAEAVTLPGVDTITTDSNKLGRIAGSREAFRVAGRILRDRLPK